MWETLLQPITGWEGHGRTIGMVTTPRWAWFKYVRESMCYAYDLGELLFVHRAM